MNLSEFLNFIIKRNKLSSLVNLITLEINAPENNGEVGGPIDVIAIYKKGSKWLTNNKY